MSTTTVRQDKDANAKLDYVFDWEAFVDADVDAIASAQVISPAGISVTGTTITASTVKVFVSGGTEGTTYAVINRIFTTGGRREDKTLELTITDSPSASHTIVVETGQSGANSNSYASVADADTYHAGHLYATGWAQSETGKKEKALIMATRLLDQGVKWKGFAANDTQALQWPRHNVMDRAGFSINSNEMPQDLIDATAELARLLLASDRTAEDDTKGFRSIGVGSIKLDIDKADRKDVIDRTVARMVSPLGFVIGGQVRLVRT